MISIPTVLILGAGSSNHCGYPLGRQLVADICSLRLNGGLTELPPEWSGEEAQQFILKLSRSDPGSIDSFLERNRAQSDLGKFLIARQLKEKEDLDTLFPPRDAGWYRYVFDRLFAEGLDSAAENALTVVTFNYDRSLEAYLHARLQATFAIDAHAARHVLEAVPIIHVHGRLGDLDEFPYRKHATPAELLAISRQIRIIHEIADTDGGFCNEMFQAAHAKLALARRIHFLGFGFHPDNMRRFRFFSRENSAGREIQATASSLGRFERGDLLASLTTLGFAADALQNCTCNEFYSHVTNLA